MSFYQQGRNDATNDQRFDQGIQMALNRVLADPDSSSARKSRRPVSSPARSIASAI
jgi:hypothetical protein